MAVANLVTVLDPEAVILGGMLAWSGSMTLDAIQQECKRRLRPAQFERVKVLPSTLGADGVAIGAASAATGR
jgi:glucokinase